MLKGKVTLIRDFKLKKKRKTTLSTLNRFKASSLSIKVSFPLAEKWRLLLILCYGLGTFRVKNIGQTNLQKSTLLSCKLELTTYANPGLDVNLTLNSHALG